MAGNKFLKRKLANGMVVVMEKRDLPLVSFSITNRFGASHENSKIKGIAHLIEHLVFTGTKKRSHEDISREIEKHGGILNAFTSQEVTSFWFKLPSEHVFVGLDILSDILNNPVFEGKKFEKEKKVVLEEIKMLHDNPQRAIYEKMEENLYERPFGDGVIGSDETISSLKRDFVYDFFKKNYSPENYIVTLVGNADFDKVCAYLEKNFKEEKKKLKPIKIVLRNLNSIEVREGIDQTHFLFGMHAPLSGTKEFYAFEVLDAYLANGMSSRLFLEIREKRGLAYSVKSSFNSEKNYSYYTIYVGTKEDAVKEVEEIIVEEFEKAKEMSEKELNEAKERVIGLKKVSSEESSNVMTDIMFYEFAGKAEDYYEYEKNINSVKLEDIKKAAELKKYSISLVKPKPNGRK